MTDFSLDRAGSARLALSDVIRDYGIAGIDDDKLLGQLLPDLMAGAPRETALVQAAALARVGRLLTERIGASIPPESAVRDVAAILTERTAYDANACLWVVAEYAHAIGHPVVLTPPGQRGPVDTGPIGGEPVVGGPVDGGPHYTPGRWTPRPPETDVTSTDTSIRTRGPHPDSGPIYLPPPPPPPGRNRVLLVVGIVVAVIVLGAGAAIAVAEWPASTSSSGQASPSPSVMSPSPEPPSPPTTPTPSVVTVIPALRTVMPKDINVSSCSSDIGSISYLSDVTAYYACTEASSSTLPGMRVWGYQFGNQATFDAGVIAFNKFIKFETASAGTVCPPTTSANGYTTWHRNDKPDVVLGHVECYTDHSNGHDYVWTTFGEYTIMVAATTTSQSFSKLETWWEDNNNNSLGA